MKLVEEFKQFALKGNMIDMAVGIIIGAAFTSVVNSVVKDLLMPPLGALTGSVNFAQKFMVLKPGKTAEVVYSTVEEAAADGAITLNYGLFLNSLISFLLVAGAVFMLVKGMNRLREQFEKKQAEAPAAPAAPPEDVVLLREIRDLLAK
ncbi:MAG: large conductance mechanosensitive channel protein MscL [Nitrospirae bacterium]|nr:large conductance mechanosensitive channel protein MscL [Fimbriimonadaceae bacterium]